MFSSLIVLLAVEYLTPVFSFIPKSALAAMIIMAVILMIEPHVPRSIWKLNKLDLFPYFVAFCGSFYYLEVGLLAGTAVALLIMLSREAMPKYTITRDSLDNSVTLILKSNLSYPGMESLSTSLYSIISHKNVKFLNLDMSNSYQLDYAVLKDIKSLKAALSEISVTLNFKNFSCDQVKMQFQKAGLVPEQTGIVESQGLAVLKINQSDGDDDDVAPSSESFQFNTFETNVLINSKTDLKNCPSIVDFDVHFNYSNSSPTITENLKSNESQTSVL